MAETIKREYNIPLRRKYLLVPKYKRTNKAVSTVKEFIAKHMKSEDVKLGDSLNVAIWKHGGRNPPHHVEVVAEKNEKGVVSVDLKGAKAKEASKKTKAPAPEKKVEEKPTQPAAKPAEKVEAKPAKAESKPTAPEKKAESKPEAKPATAPKQAKE